MICALYLILFGFSQSRWVKKAGNVAWDKQKMYTKIWLETLRKDCKEDLCGMNIRKTGYEVAKCTELVQWQVSAVS